MSIQQPIATINLVTLLKRVDAEIGGCEDILSRIEATCEAVLHSDPALAAEAIDVKEAQAIDLLMQTLGDIRSCLQWLASSPSARSAQRLALDPMLRGLKLGDLRRRLLGCPDQAPDERTIDLF